MSRKLKVYVDEVKTRHTSHWDLDYLTTAEVDRLMSDGGKSVASSKINDEKPDKGIGGK